MDAQTKAQDHARRDDRQLLTSNANRRSIRMRIEDRLGPAPKSGSIKVPPTASYI
jgi:hypothetical protein